MSRRPKKPGIYPIDEASVWDISSLGPAAYWDGDTWFGLTVCEQLREMPLLVGKRVKRPSETK